MNCTKCGKPITYIRGTYARTKKGFHHLNCPADLPDVSMDETVHTNWNIDEKDAKIAALEQRLADNNLAFEHANEVIGKLEAELAKCRLNDKWNDEDKRLEVEIIGKCLVISVGIGIIAFAFETHEDNSPYNDDTNDFKKLWIVSDKLQFAKDVISAMLEESETGASPITDFIDTMSRAALEDGSIAIDEAGPIPEP